MLEHASIRPYFIRAVYQWCIDEGHTPYILVRWSEHNPSKVPPRLITDGKIVFNISPQAVRHLVVNADGIFFTARFFGQTTEVQVPLADVLSIYARENQSGISFPPLEQPPDKAADAAPAAAAPKGRRVAKADTANTADAEIKII